MSGKSQVECLHKLLDERGVSYQTDYLHTVWHVGPKLYDARNNLDGTFTVDNLMPEQVMAATLGNKREKALEELVRDMWFWGYEGHMDGKSQDWQMKHIDGVLDRMKQLGVGVIDE